MLKNLMTDKDIEIKSKQMKKQTHRYLRIEWWPVCLHVDVRAISDATKSTKSEVHGNISGVNEWWKWRNELKCYPNLHCYILVIGM